MSVAVAIGVTVFVSVTSFARHGLWRFRVNPADQIGAGKIARPCGRNLIVHATAEPRDPRQVADRRQRPEERQPSSNRTHRVEATRDHGPRRTPRAWIASNPRVSGWDEPRGHRRSSGRAARRHGLDQRRSLKPLTPGTLDRHHRKGPVVPADSSPSSVHAAIAPDTKAIFPAIIARANSVSPGLITAMPRWSSDHTGQDERSDQPDPDQHWIKQFQCEAGVSDQIDEHGPGRQRGEIEHDELAGRHRLPDGGAIPPGWSLQLRETSHAVDEDQVKLNQSQSEIRRDRGDGSARFIGCHAPTMVAGSFGHLERKRPAPAANAGKTDPAIRPGRSPLSRPDKSASVESTWSKP